MGLFVQCRMGTVSHICSMKVQQMCAGVKVTEMDDMNAAKMSSKMGFLDMP